MKRTLLLILVFFTTIKIFANHIVGGEIFYKYLGAGSVTGTSIYQVSLRLFRDCDVACGEGTNVACLPKTASVAVYPAVSPYAPYYILNLALTDSTSITLTTYPGCVANKPPVCYEIKIYSINVTLPDNNEGYIIAYQNCCRAQSINQYGSVFTASGIPGASYTANIPGKNILPGEHDNSAVFKLKDTSLVCAGSKFAIDFSAVDADADSLSYAFLPAYDGGIFYSDGCTVTPETGLVCDQFTVAGPPPYNSITYNTNLGFSGTQPLGNSVLINPATGLISGTAPSIAGHYIVNVIAYEWRNGKIIASHQKDFILHVENCDIPKADLQPVFETCKDYTLTFQNQSASPLIYSYYWDFGDTKNSKDTSLSAAPSYTYSDTGTYVVTLITNRGQDCSDTGISLAKIYPGFTPDFKTEGGCILMPYQFADLTQSKYGTVNNWKWDFGDFSTLYDTSVIQNPTYLYPKIQTAEVRLIVGDSKGCIDTVKKIVQVYDKFPLQLPFKDTLICGKDTLQLSSADSVTLGTFSWSPPINISNTNIPNPLVYPNVTTVYRVDVNDNGCSNSDSVKVNVIPFITLDAGNDTTICLTDSLQLFPVTNALYFTWSPSAGINDINSKNPFVKPLINTQYKVFATVGTCSAFDSIRINVAAYPTVVSGADTTICFGKTVNLNANTSASLFTWQPVNSLLRSNTLTPVAGPQATTAYIITVINLQGCTRPVTDTTVVTVIPKINAFAGRDTVVVYNQPLQLNATGGIYYTWTPSTGLSNPGISDPVVTFGFGDDSILYHVTVTTAEGCAAVDDIKVVVFKTEPSIFIPSAFTPNYDGLNDIIIPKVVGMKQFNYFRIYNRWGQMIFNTSSLNKGWDGTLSGIKQPGGTYVYTSQAIDYTGKPVFKKGTIVLIR